MKYLHSEELAPAVLMTFSSLILRMLRPVAIGRVSVGLLFEMGGFAFCSRTLNCASTGKVLR
jgi:hypothetical protein